MEFKVGMKVVCVNAKGAASIFGSLQSGLKEGNVYEITCVAESCCDGLIGVGIPAPIDIAICTICGARYPSGKEWMFRQSRFVPLISDFKRITFSEVTELVEVGSIIP